MSKSINQIYKEIQASTGFNNLSIPAKGVYQINEISFKDYRTRWFFADCNWKQLFDKEFDTNFNCRIALNFLFNQDALGPIDIKIENILKLRGKTLQIEDVIEIEKFGKSYPKVVWNFYNKSFEIHPSELPINSNNRQIQNSDLPNIEDDQLFDNETAIEIAQAYEADSYSDEILLQQILASDEVSEDDLLLHQQALMMDEIYEIEYFQALEMDEVSEDELLLHQLALEMDEVTEDDILLHQQALDMDYFEFEDNGDEDEVEETDDLDSPTSN